MNGGRPTPPATNNNVYQELIVAYKMILYTKIFRGTDTGDKIPPEKKLITFCVDSREVRWFSLCFHENRT